MSVLAETVSWLTSGSQWSGEGSIVQRTAEHIGYTVVTIGLAAGVALPLGLWIGHTGRFRNVAVAATGAMRALPTLGLLTLVTLIFSIGLIPPLTALVVLAIPPILAGAYAGIESTDRQTVDAARAMGMTEPQILTKVEVPLGLGVIVGGMRSAVLQVVATATVAAFVGLGGLGRFLIDGQAVSDYPQMAGGSVIVVLLALVLDGILAAAQSAVSARQPVRQPSTT